MTGSNEDTIVDIPKSMDSLVKSLCKFAREGNHFLAAEILDEGAKCDKFDERLWTPLHYACDRGNHQIVKLFLMKDPNVNIRDYVRSLLSRFSQRLSDAMAGWLQSIDGCCQQWAL